MLKILEQKTADFIAAERLVPVGGKVLLAISGGADSTALLRVLAALRLDICCAHINHQLRGDEAQRDEDFVIEQCQKLKVPLVTMKIDVRDYAKKSKLSIETAARNLRIENLVEIAKSQNCGCIATAHHKNDNAETIIDRLIRGTGLRGLCGIWPAKKFADGITFIRPLLCAARDEIIQYLNSRNLNWCTDRTNTDFAYRRNFIRHRLLPALQNDSQGDLVERLFVLSKASRGFYLVICRAADAIWPDAATMNENNIIIDSDKIANQPAEIKIEIVRRALTQLDCGEQDVTERHYTSILKLSDDGHLQLPNRVTAHRQGGKIVFARYQERECRAGFTPPVQLNIPGKTEFAGFVIEADTVEYDAAKFEMFRKNKSNLVEWFDFEKLKPPLEVRLRKRGDKFRPLGLAGEKRVGKFLTTAKVSQSLRRRLLVVADAEKIIWLCPVRISEQAKVAGQTKKVLQLRITQK
ncbi:MAG: tRNA lysidine(34) synthetase TilS [Sedimentisphaerales bacterium]|jgi:tRNA(Ile)-lysidine synthase